jgi:effector-binding domain-containing protein
MNPNNGIRKRMKLKNQAQKNKMKEHMITKEGWVRKVIFLAILITIFAVTIHDARATNSDGFKVRVSIREIEPFTYTSVRHSGPLSDMEAGVRILMSSIGRQNIAPAGTMFAVFRDIPEEGQKGNIDWEIGFPVTAHVLPQPPLTKGQWNYLTVATATHTGPIETISDPIDEMREWLDDNGYVQDGPVIVVFLNIGAEDIIPSRLQTEIMIACKEK